MIQANFADALPRLADQGLGADAILMDLGMSSMQVDRPERGFSYSRAGAARHADGPGLRRSAADLVAELDEDELATIFSTYGEERYARPIARAIVRRRAQAPITTTGDLVEVVRSAVPTPALFAGGHPAKRVFQGLRIAVNDELGSLERGLDAAFDLLAPGGRLAVISFHSLEDRMVKRFMRARSQGCICPPEMPVCGCGRAAEGALLAAKAQRPKQAELDRNPRARSALPARPAPGGARVSTRAAPGRGRLPRPGSRERQPRRRAAPAPQPRPRPRPVPQLCPRGDAVDEGSSLSPKQPWCSWAETRREQGARRLAPARWSREHWTTYS